MKLFNILCSICIIALLAGCSNRSKNSSFFDIFVEGDTVVSTLPYNYLTNVEKLNDSYLMPISSYKDILELYEKLEYTPEAWQSGIREIPRVYLTIIGDKWGTTTSKEISSENKKRLFFRGLAPLVLQSNELILRDRNHLETIRNKFRKNHELTEKEQIWIFKLAELYKVKVEDGELTASVLEELWKRVDIIPTSLALIQSATESGWGTSRFAAEGNAMYGQWSWGGNGMVPKEKREDIGNYGVAAFESLQESVCAYMLNLNTHFAYADLREKRAELRKNGEKITGLVLVEELKRYSERGESYVNSLKDMMEYNQLNPADDAYLADGDPIFLVPAPE